MNTIEQVENAISEAEAKIANVSQQIEAKQKRLIVLNIHAQRQNMMNF